MKPEKPKRDFAIDWPRVFAMGVVFLFHCARYFDTQGWHVKNPQSDEALTFFVLFLSQWMMPLFFILSGISTYYMLSYRKTGAFIKSRFTRLLVEILPGWDCIYGTCRCCLSTPLFFCHSLFIFEKKNPGIIFPNYQAFSNDPAAYSCWQYL
jgi:hypothetical protein